MVRLVNLANVLSRGSMICEFHIRDRLIRANEHPDDKYLAGVEYGRQSALARVPVSSTRLGTQDDAEVCQNGKKMLEQSWFWSYSTNRSPTARGLRLY
jgi:hypothetical protein